MNTEVMYKRILADLLSGIRSGQYPVGSRIPSEMELADSYGVSRITSKKAVEILADRGYVMRKPGRGTFVMNTAPDLPNLQQAAEDELEDEAGSEIAPETANGSSSGSQAGIDSEGAAGSAGISMRNAAAGTAEPAASVKREMTVIGVIMDNFDVTFGEDVIRGLEYECRRRGMLMMFRLTYGSVDVEKEAMREMRAAGVAGIVLMCAQGEVYNQDILKLYLEKFPLILIDRGLKGVPIPTVMTDNHAASYDLTKHLIDKGHRKIGFISHSYLTTSTISDRFEGFMDALSDNGIPMDESLLSLNMDAFLPEDSDTEKDTNVYHKLLSDFVDGHPEITAYCAVEYKIAKQLSDILVEKGLENQKDLACFDGENLGNSIPHLAYVAQDEYRMGVSAMRLMAHKLRGETLPSKELIPHEIRMTEDMT